MNRNPRFQPILKRLVLIASTTFVGVQSLWSFEPNEWHTTQALDVPKPGLVRVNLPAATLDTAKPGLEDLRLIDQTGNQVPYLIERPAPEKELTMRPTEFRSNLENGSTRLIVKTGTNAPVVGVTLETPARRFVKAVDVEGSHNGANWKKLATGESIFESTDGANKLRASFPEGAWKFLRITIDDRRSEPVPFIGVQLSKARAIAPAEAIPIKIKSRDENLGTTRLDVDLGAANLSLASLRIETNEPLFTRGVTLAAPELGDDGIRERTIADGVIYRVDVNGKSEARLDVPVELQVHTRELLVLIHNEDSPPLSIKGVSAERRLVQLTFFANQPGRYSFLTGNSQAVAPRYDLSALSDRLRNAKAMEVVVSPIVANPNYKPPEALAALKFAGARIDIEKWRFRKPLALAQSGVQQIELDPELLSHTLPDQRDVRVIRNEQQVPFLIERTSISRAINLNASVMNDSKSPSLSRWSMKLPQTALPLSRLVCTSPSPLFHREMRLWEEMADERGDKFRSELGQATWNQTPTVSKHDFIIQLDRRPQSDTLFLETDNDDNPPIELRDFRTYYSASRVLFKAAPDPPQPVWIYYGNRDATAPHYDLTLVSDELLRAERSNAVAGAEENLSSTAERVGQTLTGTSRYIFWAALALVVVALLLIMSRFLPKPQQ